MSSIPAAGRPADLSNLRLLELLPNSIVYSLDRDLRVVFAGGGPMRESRFRVADLIGQPLHESMALSAYKVAEPHLRAALAGSTEYYELEYPSGAAYQVTAGPLAVREGVVQEILVIAFDVSKLKRAEAEQRVAKERLQVAIRAANVGLWDWNLRTNRVHYSAEWKRQIGYADDEIGDEFSEWESRVHPEDLPRARETALAYAAAPWSDFGQEFRFHHKDGSYRYILAQGAMTYDADGRPAHMFGSHIDITQNKLAEQALHDSEARYRSMFEGNHSVMLLVDPQSGTIFDANQAAANYYGWTREQLRATNIYSINTQPRAAVAAEMESARRAGRSYFHFQHRLADGSLREVEAYTGPIQIGNQSLLFAIIHDITERTRTSAALRHSEAALQRSQAVAHIGHWSWDTRSNQIIWSDEMKRIFGIDPETFAGNLDAVSQSAIHPEDLSRVQALTAAVVEQQRPAETEYRVVWPDGSIHYVRSIPGDRVEDEQGRIVQLSGVVQDVTERKLTELEREQLLLQLQDQADHLSQVMRSVPEGVLLLDNGGFIRLANPRAESMLAVLASYDDDRRLTALGGMALEQLLTSPPTGQWHKLRAGARLFETIARPLESGPVPAGWVLVVRDATAEHMVQEQLQRQERLAAVGQLAAGIAHDFNNIISVIMIYAELLSETPGLAERDRGRTATIIKQAGRAARMIRQILDFSRQSVLEMHLLDLLPLLKEQEKLLRQTLPEDIEMGLHYAPGEYFVRADPTRMQQLIMNLAVNARDAMPGGGALAIELAHRTFGPAAKPPLPDMPAGEWMQITVRDSGVGIAPDHFAHIFEPFFTTKAPDRGAGLGLAQAHGIVAQHEGFIYASSEPGAGATFHIFLPASPLLEQATAGSAAPLALAQGHGETVLLVEDDAVLRASLVELLGLLNYSVVEAANGEEALARLASSATPVAMILSDVVMPKMGGVALVKTLRRRGVRTPVILMSGHPKGEDRDSLQGLDVHAWLDKPPDTQRLANELAAAQARRSD